MDHGLNLMDGLCGRRIREAIVDGDTSCKQFETNVFANNQGHLAAGLDSMDGIIEVEVVLVREEGVAIHADDLITALESSFGCYATGLHGLDEDARVVVWPSNHRTSEALIVAELHVDLDLLDDQVRVGVRVEMGGGWVEVRVEDEAEPRVRHRVGVAVTRGGRGGRRPGARRAGHRLRRVDGALGRIGRQRRTRGRDSGRLGHEDLLAIQARSLRGRMDVLVDCPPGQDAVGAGLADGQHAHGADSKCDARRTRLDERDHLLVDGLLQAVAIDAQDLITSLWLRTVQKAICQ